MTSLRLCLSVQKKVACRKLMLEWVHCSGRGREKKVDGKRRQLGIVKFLIQIPVSIPYQHRIPQLQWVFRSRTTRFQRLSASAPQHTGHSRDTQTGQRNIAASHRIPRRHLILHLCTIWPILVRNLPNFQHYIFRPYSPDKQLRAQSRP